MTLQERLAETARRLIAKNGTTAKIYRIASTFDGVTGTASAFVATQDTLTLVHTPLSQKDRQETSFKEALIAGKLQKFLIAASGLTLKPQPNDIIVNLVGDVFRVLGGHPLRPGELDIIFYVFVENSSLTTGEEDAIDDLTP